MARLVLDHITIHCRDLEASRRFYAEVLDLAEGYRPPFDGPPGAWLYDVEQRPVVHLYAGRDSELSGPTPLNHIAFVSDDLSGMKQRLEALGIAYGRAIVPEIGAEQIFLDDPDGIGLEISNASAADLIRGRTT